MPTEMFSAERESPATFVVESAVTFDVVRVPRVGLIRRTVRRIFTIVAGTASAVEWLFGAMILMIGLAAIAAIPVFQFLSLGYLLESSARVARSGRLRDGFIGVRLAARLGGIVVGCWLLLLPVRFVADYARSAAILDPGGPVARNWRTGMLILITITAFHIAATCARGGRLRSFLWPFNVVWFVQRLFRGGYYAEARDAVWDTLMNLRLPYYFWLGARGFAAAFVWLVIPVTLLGLGRIFAPFGFLGALALAWVLVNLPFLQLRLAVEDRFAAGFELRKARTAFARAPWIATIAIVMTLLTALPLYLLKIEVVPAEAAWLPGLVFIAFIFPARLLAGWAMSWSLSRRTPRHWFFRWTGRLALVPAAAFYVTVVYFTQFTSWHGVWSLYEQHAFLLPAPFLGL